MGLLASGMTDIGQKRKTNQDAIYLNTEKNLFIVADGMGGHNGGDIASAMAVECIPKYLISKIKTETDPIKLSQDSIQYANDQIKKRGEEETLLAGMGTTVVNFLFKGAHLYLSNVGDSRAYLVNRKKLYQLTSDHSLVQEKLNLGFYNRAEAAADPQKNVLIRTVGFEEDIEIDTFSYKVHRNDIFLTCSDGLHGKVSDEDIVYILNKNIPNPASVTQQVLDDTVKELVDLANKNGGQDNISVIIIVAQ